MGHLPNHQAINQEREFKLRSLCAERFGRDPESVERHNWKDRFVSLARQEAQFWEGNTSFIHEPYKELWFWVVMIAILDYLDPINTPTDIPFKRDITEAMGGKHGEWIPIRDRCRFDAAWYLFHPDSELMFHLSLFCNEPDMMYKAIQRIRFKDDGIQL